MGLGAPNLIRRANGGNVRGRLHKQEALKRVNERCLAHAELLMERLDGCERQPLIEQAMRPTPS